MESVVNSLASQISDQDTILDEHGLEVEPSTGRFYPQGFFQGVQGIYKEAVDPSRIIGLTQDRMDLDLNHPLAREPLRR